MSGQTNPPTQGEWSESEQGPLHAGGEPAIDGEIVPREEHSGVDVRIPGPVEPAPPQKIAVSKTTARWVLLTLVVLLALVAALLYLVVKPATKPAADASNTKPTATAVAATASAAPSDSPSPTTAPGGASPAASGDATPSTSAQVSVSGSPNPGFSPINGTVYLGTPIDGSSVDTKIDVQISGTDYPYSSRFYCPNSYPIDWNVAGYSTFTTTLGVPDNASGATGATITMTFSDQNGKVLSVNKTAIGQPATVHIPLSGVDRLVISCNRTANNGGGYNFVALGNAAVS